MFMLEMPISSDVISVTGPDGAQTSRVQFLSGDMNTRAVLHAVETTLLGAGVSAKDTENIELVLAEVLNNVTEHAYRGTSGPVEMILTIAAGAVECTIRDQGRPMPGGAPPKGHVPRPDCPVEALPEGGFGWFIIHRFTRDLTLQSCEGWNVLHFVLPLTAEPG